MLGSNRAIVKHPMRSISILLASVALLGTSVALASHVRFEEVGLPRAVTRASEIVRARYLSAEATRGPYRFVVEEPIRGDGLARDQIIRVWSAESASADMVRRAYERTGAMRSPLIYRLRRPPSAPLVADHSYCLLLRRNAPDPADYAFAVADAHVAAPCDTITGQPTPASPSAQVSASTPAR